MDTADCFSQEHRTKSREQIEFPLKIHTFNNNYSGDETFYGKAVDISEGGMGLLTTQTIPTEDHLVCIVNIGEYAECLIGNVVWHSKCRNGNRYGLRLKRMKNDVYHTFLSKLRNIYYNLNRLEKNGNQFISSDAVLKINQYLNTSTVELNQIKVLDKCYVHKTNDEQVWISDIRNADEYAWEIDELRHYTVFYTYAYPNLKCPVCFDHSLDHYPMMSLFEMTRQMGLAIMHQFYHVPMSGYISIVQKLAFDYRVFAELDFPLTVYLIDICEPAFVDKVQNRKVELFFVQENVICAHVLGEMSAIKTELYSRVRKSARKSKLISKFGSTSDVTFITNEDAAFLYSPKNKFQYNPVNQE